MTNEDIYEMKAIKSAIEMHPASVHFNKMEKFAELWVKQMKEQFSPLDNQTETN